MTQSSRIQSGVEQVQEQFANVESVEPSDERVASDIEELLSFSIPMAEAVNSVISDIESEHDLDGPSGKGRTEIGDIGDALGEGEWINIRGEILQLWDADHESVLQTGLIGDETGKTKFTVWSSSFDEPQFDEGDTVQLQSVVTDEYEGNYSVNVNSETAIAAIDESFDIPDNSMGFSGALVAIQPGSGLVKRCPHEDCTRVLQNGRCSEHGEVDGEFDLRIKGVLDNGSETQKVLLDREMTEDVGGITLEEAKDEAMDALDTTVVANQLRDRLVGQYYRVEGREFGQNLLANDVVETERASVDDLLVQARTLQAERAGGAAPASAD